MLKTKAVTGVLMASALTLTFLGCKKYEEPDVINRLTSPYTLFLGTDQGIILNTNDGDNYRSYFSADGSFVRNLLVADTNLIAIKQNLYVSTNDGTSFNLKFPMAGVAASVSPNYFNIIKKSKSHKRTYLSTFGDRGIYYSEDNGLTWRPDLEWTTAVPTLTLTLAETQNGFMYTNTTNNIYIRKNAGDKWAPVGKFGLPNALAWFLTGYNNDIQAFDPTGTNGIWYSTNDGGNFAQVPNSQNIRILSVQQVAPDFSFVGTDSMGVYKLKNNALIPSGAGIPTNAQVYNFISKYQTFKAGNVNHHIYAVTSMGLFRLDTSDQGESWVKVKNGFFTAGS